MKLVRRVAEGLVAALDRTARRELARRRFREGFPRAGFAPATTPTPRLDRLTDAELDELNGVLEWNCFTTDARGRRFGAPAKAGKRDEPQPLPDPRIVRFDARFGLAGKSVLEIGCFEGVHTIALCQRARAVTAIDARVENVAKTLVRCAFHGVSPLVFPWDVESATPPPAELSCDLAHHVGVLYHLAEPVGHLLALGRLVRLGLLIDTQVARPDEATESWAPAAAGGRAFAYRRFREDQKRNVFAGTRDHARWLTRSGLEEALALAGFAKFELIEERDERNGARVCAFASRA